jgi:uncharacterized membrane-anchored protein
LATAPRMPVTQEVGRIRGVARVDQRTKNLINRLRPGDIAVIDHADLDGLAARSLVEAKVSAVINARPFISGKYPNRGPAVLSDAGVPMFSLDSPELFPSLHEGAWLVVDSAPSLYQSDKPICKLTKWDADAITTATHDARANLGVELERFARNTLQYLDADKDLLLDPTDVPNVRIKIAGRHVLVVVRGENYKTDLGLLRSYIEEIRPVLIAVDGGADALIAMGYKPDIILGDMDSVSDDALKCGAQIIVHAYARRGGEAPGIKRINELGLTADVFPVPGTSEDAALLLAYEHNADLIVAVGTHSYLEDFLDKGRPGMASTFLVRLKVGPKLVDARGVSKLYQAKPPFIYFVAVILCALFPVVLILSRAPIWHNIKQMLHIWWQLHFPGHWHSH